MSESTTPAVAPSRPTRGTPIGPGEPEEVEAVTGRPNDDVPDNSTFAGRAGKAVQSAENKAVKAAKKK